MLYYFFWQRRVISLLIPLSLKANKQLKNQLEFTISHDHKILGKKYILFFLGLLFSFSTSYSQINGIILDSISKNPVEFATIAYQGQMRGTITNAKGQFVLDEKDISGDTILISHLNYEPKKLALLKLADFNHQTVLLVEAVHQVDEVTVVVNQIPNLLKRAIDNSKQNLPHHFLAHTYIREFVKEDENVTKFSDGMLDFYVDDLDEKSRKISARVNQSRTLEINNGDDESTFDIISPLDIRKVFVLIKPDNLERFIDDKNFYDFSISEHTNKDGSRVREIKFEPKKDIYDAQYQYKGQVVIDLDDNLIIEYRITLINQEYQETKNLLIFKGRLDNHFYTVRYNIGGENYFPAFASQNIGLHIWNKKSVDARFDFKSDCLISQIVDVDENPVSRKDNYKNKSLFKLGHNYSEPFWVNKGTFSLTDDEKQIIEEIAGKVQ